ncbi:MAG TPA: branched-chain amino acid ABC transporter permease [Ktedonobacterales bacterium]|nr:branched-chain amino acid ABC transporter permease [Ktedonobacterales bacterium]
MSTPAQSVGNRRASQPWLDNTKIAGRPLRFYLSGWRGGLIALIIALVLPTAMSLGLVDPSLLVPAIAVGIYVLLALGLNIVVGYAGLLDLGYVAFFVIGSYTVATGSSGLLQAADGHTVINIPQFSFWVLLPLGAVLAGFFGVLLGAPTLRLRGDYLAIVTLGFGEIVPIVFQNIPFFFGQLGMSALPPPPIGPIDFSNPLDRTAFYYLTVLLIALVVLAVVALRDSSLGRAWVAIREDETAAQCSGVNLVRTKLLAFGLGAVTGGIGGALNAGFLTAVAPSDFNFGISITILVMIVLGGLGSIPGVIVGAIILRFVDVYLLGQLNQWVHGSVLVADNGAPLHFLSNFDFNTSKYLIYGLVLMIIILLRPQGLIPDVRRQRELAGIGAAPESMSVVGLVEQEEEAETAVPLTSDSFAGAGSDAQDREG